MTLPKNRRAQPRRNRLAISEGIERKGERRAEDRRDSPRIKRRLKISAAGEATVLQELEGEGSLGGASWKTRAWPPTGPVLVRFRLPDVLGEVSAVARIIQAKRLGRVFEVHVRFVQMDLISELALARFLDGRSRLHRALAEDVPARPLES